MPYDDLVRAITMAVAFAAQLAGHYVGDHWFQSDEQACRKALGNGGPRWTAFRNCGLHVLTWTLTTTTCFTAAAWWLHLPVRPGWLAAGIAVNAVTHFVADLRTPLIWIAQHVGRAPYITNVQVVRPGRADRYGPGTALFHLDQSWHIAWLLVSSLLMAGH